ncbi:MAG: MMPL family transporter, partial [Stackebrandtia sp.]
MTTTLRQTEPAGPARAAGLVARLSDWSARHRVAAILIWVMLLAGVTVAAQAVGSDYHDDHSLPGTESQQISELMAEHVPKQDGDSLQIVVSGSKETIAENRGMIEAALDDIAALDHVDKVDNPFEVEHNWSPDGTVGFATVTLDGKSADVPAGSVRDIIDTAKDAETGSLRVELGGDPIRGAEESAGGAAEGAGMLAALVILVFMFGSLLAAAVPLGTAVFAVGSTLGAITLASQVFTLPSYLPPLMMLVGLGVGVDYALLIFSRYRSEIRDGADRDTAARTAADTAGRSVLFAGCTVIVALLGLFALGLGALQGVALGVALTVLVTMLASVTLLPALLALFGKRIEARIHKRAAKTAKQPGHGWRRWGAVMQRRPVAPLLLAVAALAALCFPALDMRLGFADAGTEAPGSTSRAAYDLMSEGFGAGSNGPIMVVTEGSLADAKAAAAELADVEGVADTTPAIPIDEDLAMVQVFG